MSHELIIIIKTDENGEIPRHADHHYDPHDITKHSLNKGFIVKLDGYPLGTIQHLTIDADSETWPPKIEITFPDYNSPVINPNSKNYLKSDTESHIQDLKVFKDVKILLKDYSTCMDDSIKIREISTDRIIDIVDIW